MTDIDREIMLAVLSREAGELERRLHEAHLETDREYGKEFERIRWVWSECSRIAPFNAGGRPPAPESIIARAEERLKKPAGMLGPPGRVNWIRGAAAACLIAVLGAGVVVFRGRGVSADSRPTVILTEADETTVVTLEDGTVVRLAPSSRLAFSATQGRTVDLEGRAYFAVTHREGDPFRVRLPERTITVLGTRFDVEARDGQVKVAVVEGEVRLSGAAESVTARADQVAYGPDSGALVLQDVEDVFETVDWLGPFLAFESTPLSEVVDELERRFSLRIDVAEDFPRSTVTGWFSNQSPEGIVAAICTAVGARCIMTGSAVRMDRQGAGPAPGTPPRADIDIQEGA